MGLTFFQGNYDGNINGTENTEWKTARESKCGQTFDHNGHCKYRALLSASGGTFAESRTGVIGSVEAKA
jgi:hypothetical protein